MKKVYLLYHSYEYDETSELKILGIYSTYENAEDAKRRYFQLEGFKKYPEQCFFIEAYSLDNDENWLEGFISSDELEEEFCHLTIIINQWLEIEKTPKESWKNENHYDFLTELSYRLNTSETISELAKHIQNLTKNYLKTEKNYCDCQKVSQKIFNCIKNK